MKFRKLILRLSASLLMVGIMLQINGNSVHAADGSMNYQVSAKLPASQHNKNVSYFDLRLKPNQEETIKVEIKNTDDKEHTYNVIPNTAITNENGVVDYSQPKKKADKTAPANLKSLVSGEEKVVVAANSTKDATFKIKMPSKSYDGVLLGGFNISRKGSTGVKTQSESVTVRNNFAYVIGLRITENDTLVTPHLKMNEIKAGLVHYRTAVTANLQNTKATMISGMKVDAKITKRGSKTVLHRAIKSDLAMAPNSNFNYQISWDNEQLAAGKYTLDLTASDKSGQQWHFTRHFEIKNETAKRANKSAVDLKKKSVNWWYIIGIAIVIILIAYIIYLKLKSKKD